MAGIRFLRAPWLTLGYSLVRFQALPGNLFGVAFVILGMAMSVRWFVSPAVATAENRGILAGFGRVRR